MNNLKGRPIRNIRNKKFSLISENKDGMHVTRRQRNIPFAIVALDNNVALLKKSYYIDLGTGEIMPLTITIKTLSGDNIISDFSAKTLTDYPIQIDGIKEGLVLICLQRRPASKTGADTDIHLEFANQTTEQNLVRYIYDLGEQ